MEEGELLGDGLLDQPAPVHNSMRCYACCYAVRTLDEIPAHYGHIRRTCFNLVNSGQRHGAD